MKIKTSEATERQLDWLVAMCKPYGDGSYWVSEEWLAAFRPSSNWSQAGPIIEREGIAIEPWGDGTWVAKYDSAHRLQPPRFHQHGPTPLIAAMRCYVASKLGDEAEIPEELK